MSLNEYFFHDAQRIVEPEICLNGDSSSSYVTSASVSRVSVCPTRRSMGEVEGLRAQIRSLQEEKRFGHSHPSLSLWPRYRDPLSESKPNAFRSSSPSSQPPLSHNPYAHRFSCPVLQDQCLPKDEDLTNCSLQAPVRPPKWRRSRPS